MWCFRASCAFVCASCRVRKASRSAHTCVVLADSSKLGAVAPAFVFGLDRLDTLVTDADADAGEVSAIEAHGVRVIVARDPERSALTR